MHRALSLLALTLLCGSGCALVPDVMHEPQFHNPFPQLYRVAVLPFANQSKEPTVDGDRVAIAYYNELQAVRGFEVMPVGVAKKFIEGMQFDPKGPEDIQKLARLMGVDAIVIGSITEYSPYYPPRMGLAVNWYAANPSFHPIPAGYGLPWGTPHECDIPEELVFDAEMELARKQLDTQTPEMPPSKDDHVKQAKHQASNSADGDDRASASELKISSDERAANSPTAEPLLPAEWPDPRGFIPPAPSLQRAAPLAQREPILTHTKMYHGTDADFTAKLEKYCYFRDDARFGGWQNYLQRSDDFMRFCCHLHVTEMLAARGGVGKPRVVYRWPISRYDR